MLAGDDLEIPRPEALKWWNREVSHVFVAESLRFSERIGISWL